MKKRTTIRIISFLAAATVALGAASVIFYRRAVTAEREERHRGEYAFSELCAAADGLSAALEKSQYAVSPAITASLCAEVYSRAQTASAALSSLSVPLMELENTASFFARTGDYALWLLRESSGGDDVSEEARENLRALGDTAALLSGAGESEGKIPVYRFTGGDYTVSVSRKGGYVVRALSQRAPVRSAITVDAALEKAAEFLAAHGCRGMKESYHILKDHVLTVTYCAEQNGVMCYPDMVKLAVAMDTGEMLRFDAEAYLTSHAERDLPEPAVSEEDARAMAGEGLTVQSEKLAVIPTSGAEEIYCRELICETEDGRHYLLYVNAMTGAQEKILILLEDESGTLAL